VNFHREPPATRRRVPTGRTEISYLPRASRRRQSGRLVGAPQQSASCSPYVGRSVTSWSWGLVRQPSLLVQTVTARPWRGFVTRIWRCVAELGRGYAANAMDVGRSWVWSSNVVPSPERVRPWLHQEGLAEHLGVDRTTVARWEAGRAEPKPWQRPKIDDAFGLSLLECNQLLDDVGTTGHTVDVSAALVKAQCH
jgi:Helix-turn-helix domain